MARETSAAGAAASASSDLAMMSKRSDSSQLGPFTTCELNRRPVPRYANVIRLRASMLIARNCAPGGVKIVPPPSSEVLRLIVATSKAGFCAACWPTSSSSAIVACRLSHLRPNISACRSMAGNRRISGQRLYPQRCPRQQGLMLPSRLDAPASARARTRERTQTTTVHAAGFNLGLWMRTLFGSARRAASRAVWQRSACC